MTRDYAKNPSKKRRKPASKSSRQKKKTGAPGWIWLLAGILLGVLIMLLVELAKVPAEDIEQATASEPEESIKEGNKETRHKPRFDFYTLLRETEVIVPDGPETERELRESTADTAFLLQVGSFKNAKDADSLRARLLLLNLTANIETFTSDRGEKWYRVLVGPFSNNSQVASAKGKLASNGIDSLLLKRTE